MDNEKQSPLIREQTLEHIARVLGEQGSGPEIIRWLLNWGVPRQSIEYPNTKWVMIFTILANYSHSTKKEDHEILLKIIGEILHPLRYNGDKNTAQKVADDFNNYLDYDGITATYSGDDKKYYVYKGDEIGISSEEAQDLLNSDLFNQECNELEFLRLPENKERTATLREAYQALINIVLLFCKNPSTPTTELNNAYVECKGLITSTVLKLDLYNFNKVYRLSTYSLPFTTLFSAEKHCQQNGTILNWDAIRPEMYATYSDIEEIYYKAHGTSIPLEPDAKKILNDVSSLVAKTQEQDKKLAAEKKSAEMVKPEHTIKMEITKMPELQIKNVEESILMKGKKRIHLPKFKSTDWLKITIRFIDKRNVLITTDKKEVAPADYESLGFSNDKSDKPNSAWMLLYTLALNNGETGPLGTPIPDTVRQHKKQLSDRLKAIFKNETEPFYDPTETNTYRIKINLIAPEEISENADKLGVQEYLDETMTQEEER